MTLSSSTLLGVSETFHGFQNGLVGVGRRYDGNVETIGVVGGKSGSGVKSDGSMTERGIHDEEALLY